MVKSRLLLGCTFFLVLSFLQINIAKAQMVGPDSYIQGTSVEIGIRGLGGFEGVQTSTSPAPAGYHGRSSTGYFGFVANPQLNNWLGSAYDGDFFTPGSPENGWGFEIGTGAATSKGNNCTGLQQINGAITGWSHTFNCYNTDWEGDYTSGTDLHFKINYFLQQTDLFYTTTVSITNNTTATIPDMYYYRNVDPDNNEEIGAGFTTTNTIVSEPGASGCDLAHVSATQSTPWNSYLGFAATGANWRADYGGFSNRDASDLWTGGTTTSGTFTQTVGSVNTADEAISLAYRIQNLAPGATETFKFVVILDAAEATAAINNLLYLSYPGSLTAPPAVCTPYTDTVRTCGGPVPISISGPIVSDYTWAWTPAAGLSPSTGPSITANPAVTTTYTAVGTPINPCVAPISIPFVVQVTPAGGTNPVITPVGPVCQTTPPFNLTVDSTGGTWMGTGITNTTLGTFDPSVAGPGTHLITYYTSAWCNSTDTMNIVVLGSASATIVQPAPVCAGTPAFNLTAGAPGGTWSGTGITSPSAGTFDPTTAGSFIINYAIGGTCPSNDTVVVTVNPVFDATITQPAPICVSAAPITLTAASPGGAWSGVGITSTTAGIFNPATAGVGTHLITYSISGPCLSVDTVNVTVLSIFNATITNVAPVCVNAAAFNMTAVSPGGTWSGTGITNPAAGTFDPATAGAGLHTITYTISGLCGAMDTSVVNVVALPVLSFVADTTQGCEPTTITFTSSTDQPGGTYAWDFGVPTITTDTSSLANPSYQYLTGGTYTVGFTYTNTIGCASTSVSTNLITIHSLPVAAFTSLPQTVDIITPTVNFTDQSTGAVNTWLWSFGDGSASTVQNPTYSYASVGTFTVQLDVRDIYGCTNSVTHPVTIDPVYLYYAPNAFTPNGDGDNDVFMIKGDNINPDSFEMSIYDRWGERIFRTTDLNTGWNGAKNNIGPLVQQDVYVYKINLKDWRGIKHQYIGSVTIVK
ncbi:MAG: PKD domain-containing protein [Bacteroidia bacterium]